MFRHVLIGIALLFVGCATVPGQKQSFDPETAFLQEIILANPQEHPRVAFTLFNRLSATKQQRAGVEFFERTTKDKRVSGGIEAVHLSILGALRAQTASQIPLLQRVAWVEQAIGELNQAVTMTDEKLYIVRWLRAVVFARLPERFDVTAIASKELDWSIANIDKAPACLLYTSPSPRD